MKLKKKEIVFQNPDTATMCAGYYRHAYLHFAHTRFFLCFSIVEGPLKSKDPGQVSAEFSTGHAISGIVCSGSEHCDPWEFAFASAFAEALHLFNLKEPQAPDIRGISGFAVTAVWHHRYLAGSDNAFLPAVAAARINDRSM